MRSAATAGPTGTHEHASLPVTGPLSGPRRLFPASADLHRLRQQVNSDAVDLLRLGMQDGELGAVVLEDGTGRGDAVEVGGDEAAERVVAGVLGEVEPGQAVQLVDVDPGVGVERVLVQ